MAMAADYITIDQNKALAGGITPNDTPGFPITLSQPGNYKLTSNLLVPAGVGGIYIEAFNVTLDLNGFAVIGPATCTGSGAARACTGVGSSNGIEAGWLATIRNGTVRGFTGVGINGLNLGSIVDSMLIRDNGREGLLADGADITVTRSIVTGNGADGIFMLKGPALLADIIASNNGKAGIRASYGASVDQPVGGGQFRRVLMAGNGGDGLAVSLTTYSTTALSASNLVGNAYNMLYGVSSVTGNACNGAAC
jgi:hypothetical protein